MLAAVGTGLAALGLGTVAGCKPPGNTFFTRLAEARKLAADLRVQFAKASDASNRAVMAETDEASLAFAAEATQAGEFVVRDADELAPILRQLDYAGETGRLEQFRRDFAEYERLDHTVLDLAVENSNLKAQRLRLDLLARRQTNFKRPWMRLHEPRPPRATAASGFWFPQQFWACARFRYFMRLTRRRPTTRR